MSAHMGIKEQKQLLRADYLAHRRALDPQKKTQMDQAIASTFTSLASYRLADILLLYYPRSDEVDIRPILRAAWESGKAVALPRCREKGEMDFCLIKSEDDLAEGAFGLREPKAHCPLFDPAQTGSSVLMAVPGLAFDRRGYRLGYGKGYYDRYLAGRSISTVGLVYSAFVAQSLPHGRFDLPISVLITEKGVMFIE